MKICRDIYRFLSGFLSLLAFFGIFALWRAFKKIIPKTTHNTFRDCHVHFFRQPFSKLLNKGDIKPSMKKETPAFELINVIKVLSVITFGPKCNKGPKCNNFWP